MAGEIQIGGTTFATESGGTVTVANVNSATNRTNLGLGSIATQAADSVSISGGNITGGTIGSGVTFPAGHPHTIKVYEETTSSGNTTSTGIGFGTVRSVSLSAGENVLIIISGGHINYNGGAQCYAGIQYDTSTLTTNTQGTISYNIVDAESSTPVNYSVFAHYEFIYTAGSGLTLYYRPAVGNNNGKTSNWEATTDSIKITEIRFL